jgi:hypothetical protein
VQGVLERLDALSAFDTTGGVLALRSLELRQGFRNVYRNRLARATQRVLMDDVAGYCKEVRLRVAYRLVPLHAQQAQIDFLCKVGDIKPIPQAQ